MVIYSLTLLARRKIIEQDLKQETSNHKSASELEYGRRIIRLIEIPD